MPSDKALKRIILKLFRGFYKKALDRFVVFTNNHEIGMVPFRTQTALSGISY